MKLLFKHMDKILFLLVVLPMTAYAQSLCNNIGGRWAGGLTDKEFPKVSWAVIADVSFFPPDQVFMKFDVSDNSSGPKHPSYSFDLKGTCNAGRLLLMDDGGYMSNGKFDGRDIRLKTLSTEIYLFLR